MTSSAGGSHQLLRMREDILVIVRYLIAYKRCFFQLRLL